LVIGSHPAYKSCTSNLQGDLPLGNPAEPEVISGKNRLVKQKPKAAAAAASL